MSLGLLSTAGPDNGVIHSLTDIATFGPAWPHSAIAGATVSGLRPGFRARMATANETGRQLEMEPDHEDQTMTLAAFAANASRAPLTEADYRPGVCNIGPAEIARRRRAGHVGLIATIVLLVILVAIDAPPLARLLVAIPAVGAASGYLQAWFKFCAGFGSRGVFNFGPLGDTNQVVDPDARARDRSRANRIGLASLAIGVAVGILAVVLPL